MSRVTRLGGRTLEVFAILLAWASFGQATSNAQTFALSDTQALVLLNVKADAVEYKGRKAVRLTNDTQKDGFALLRGTDFQDGTIEGDIALKITTPPGVRMPGFVGIAFRARPDASRYELFYLRPRNSRSDDQAMRNHSVQYTSEPDFGWYKLRQKWPWVYEAYANLQTDSAGGRMKVEGLADGRWTATRVDPFVGKWKLNPFKSKLTDRMKVESLGANRYALDFGGGVETVVADGTDQSGNSGTTVSITVEGPDTWKVVRKKGGRTLLTGIWKLSRDGKTLSDTFRANQPDGSTLSLDYVYERTSAGSGFAGTWESTSEKVNSVFEFQIQPYQGDGLSFITPAEHETQNMRFDGKDYPDAGPDVSPGSASSGRRVNERTLEMTDTIKGKVMDTRQIKLSTDLKTLTMTVHPVGQSKPNMLVFDRE